MNFTVPGLEGYFGSKGSAGVAQAIINIIPPHETFIVPFLGHCAITRSKIFAKKTIIIDLDKEVCKKWEGCLAKSVIPTFVGEKNVLGSYNHPSIHIINKSAIDFLQEHKHPTWCVGHFLGETVLYCDPPYVWEKRTSKNKYRHDWEEKDHIRFLELIKNFPAKVIISHYENNLYNKHLKGWNTIKYNSMTRAGQQREEVAYFNYEHPTELHDYSFYGGDYREREDFTRKAKRMVKKWAGWSKADRNYFAHHLRENGLI